MGCIATETFNIMLYFFYLHTCKQKLNRCIAACGDYFAINRMSKYASVLCNPEVHSEQSIDDYIHTSLEYLTT